MTAIRFAAALSVYLYHCRALFRIQGGQDPEGFIQSCIALGFLGVPFFFTLSGFILFVVYAERAGGAREKASRLDRKRFLAARVARVMPVYLLCLAISLPLFFFDSREATALGRASALLTAPLLLQAWIPAAALLWNPAGWSLSVEATLYLSFPWLFERMNHAPLHRVGLAVLASLASGWLFLTLLFAIAPELDSPGAFQPASSSILKIARYFPLVHLPAFLAGMFSGALFLRWRLALTQSVSLILALLAAVLGTAVAVYAPKINYLHLHNWLFAPVFACLLVSLAALNARFNVRSIPGAVLLGESSYAFYLLHLTVLRFYSKAIEVATGAKPLGWLHVLACLLVVTFLSAVTHLWFERPLRQWVLDHALKPKPSV